MSKKEMEQNFEDLNHNKVRVVKAVPDRTLVIFLIVVILLLIGGLVTAIIVLQNQKTVVYVNNGTVSGNMCKTANCYSTSAEVLGSINTSVNPCDNFYQYACGGWFAKNEIPDDRSTYNTFTVVSVKNEKVMRKFLTANYTTQSGEGEQKAIKYFQSCFNDMYTETNSRMDLKNMIKGLGGWSAVPSIMPVNLTTWNYNTVLANMVAMYDNSPLFNTWIGSDLKNSKLTVITMSQSGLTLPGVSYYYRNRTHFAVTAFIEYMTDVAMIMGATNRTATKAKMEQVYEFEKKIAKAFIHNLNVKDEEISYFKSSLAGMTTACPAIDFSGFANRLLGRNFQPTEPVVTYSMNYFKRLSAIVASTPKETMNNYLMWQFIKTFTSAADSQLLGAYQKYREQLYGKPTPSPLWRTCAYRANSALGMAVGAMFVRQAFSSESRTTAKSMIEELRAEFVRTLPTLNWMDDATRKVAAEKANAIIDQIGYPDFILNKAQLATFYSTFPINESYYFINVINRRKYAHAVNLAQYGKPFNKFTWITTPAIVNAFYSSTRNQIVFPAGILQSPFYDVKYPKVMNYGAIGAVIGHEITHGFDNNGRRFNKDGELVQWWNNDTIKTFNARAKCFVDQYGAFTYFGFPVGGNLTLGENIADNGGMGQAFRAYQAYVKKNGPEPTLPGVPLTNEQLFFVSFARNWCGRDTYRYGVGLVLTDSHAPRIYRVLGTLRNSQDFAKAFNCPVGSGMNPVHKCKIW